MYEGALVIRERATERSDRVPWVCCVEQMTSESMEREGVFTHRVYFAKQLLLREIN